MLLLISILGYADFNTLRDGHSKLSPAKIDMPKLHASYTDPVFGTTIKRITSPSQISPRSIGKTTGADIKWKSTLSIEDTVQRCQNPCHI